MTIVAVAALATAGLAKTGEKQIVVVRAGDTLSALAVEHGVTAAALAEANGVVDPDQLRVGQVLEVPDGDGDDPEATSPSFTPMPPPEAVVSGELPPSLQADTGRLALLPRFDHWAATYGVPADLLKAVAWQESGWQNHVVSSVGAQGIGQLMPDTVDFVNHRLLRAELDPDEPDDNIQMSARFLRYLLERTGDESDAVAAYYQGLASIRAKGRYAETDAYVTSVGALRARFD